MSTKGLAMDTGHPETGVDDLDPPDPGDNPSPPLSFSAMTSMSTTSPSAPEKSHGVLIRRAPGVTLGDLLESLSKVIEPSKILYADFVGAANFGVWVDSDESVAQLVARDMHEVKGQLTKINLYAKPVRRVILRNVPPFLPDNTIINALSVYGEARGSIEHQSAFNVGDKFKHVKSFTRTINLAINNGVTVPPRVKVAHGDLEHVIYIQIGPKKCFKCGNKGHNSKDCPKKNENKENKPEGARKTIIISQKKVTASTSSVLPGGEMAGNSKKSALDSISSQPSDKSVVDSDVESTGTVFVVGDEFFEPVRKRQKGRLAKDKSSKLPPPSPWSFDHWKDKSFQKYKTMNNEGLFIFLQSVKLNFMSGGYYDVEKSIAMVTKNPQELYDLLFEVINSLGTLHMLIKSQMKIILLKIEEYLKLSPEGFLRIRGTVDFNFRNFEMQDYQKKNNLTDESMIKLKKFFFN
jgi:zinc knuckle protein